MMNSSQGRETIFTNVNLRTIIPPKHTLKRSQDSIKTDLGVQPRTKQGSDIFQDGGKKKYEQNKSIDFSKNKLDDFSVQKKGMGTYNTEYLRRQLETNQNQTQQVVRNEENKKIKTYYNDPSIKQNAINKDFQIKADSSSQDKVNQRPNYYLSSKNIQRTFNQENNLSQTQKINTSNYSKNLSSSFIADNKTQYPQQTKQMATTTSNTNINKYQYPTHQRCNTETSSFNQVPRNLYKTIHTNKVGIQRGGASFYMN